MTTKQVAYSSVVVVLLALLGSHLWPNSHKLPPGGASGYAAPGWRQVADAFRRNLDSGLEEGAAFALFYRGDLVVEFSGGYADYEAEVPWTEDTLCQICSSTKGIAAVTMAVLVDRGLLNYEQRVSHYWPEFGQNGKQDITVEQLFSHQAGLAVIDETFSTRELITNMDRISAILAKQSPNWTPGEDIGYHGQTVGLYMDQLVRRIDPRGRNLPTFFKEEIAKPFGLEIYMGLPLEMKHRTARVYDLKLFSLQTLLATRYWPVIWTFITQPDSLTTRSILNPKSGNINSPLYQEIWNPSTHGFGTAVSLAKLFSVVANGGALKGKTLMSPHRAHQLAQPVKTGNDVILKMNLTYGRGTTIRDTPLGSHALGTPGAGGQMVYADPTHNLAWAYITNHHSVYAIGDDPRYLALEQAIYDSLRKIQARSQTES